MNLDSLVSKLLDFFSVFGLPKEIVSDNGPPFQSFGFKKFCQSYGIKCTKSPPYHPQSNGLAERHVQVVKKIFKKMVLEENGLSMSDKINKFLIYQRNSPSAKNSTTPSELIFAFKPKTMLDLINEKKKVNFDLSENNVNYNSHSKQGKAKKIFSKFYVGEIVFYRNPWKQFVNWLPAKIEKVLSPLTYLISVNDNVRYVHQNQLRNCLQKSPLDKVIVTDHIIPSVPILKREKDNELKNYKRRREISSDSSPEVYSKSPTILRRSKRLKRIPKRFTFSEFN